MRFVSIEKMKEALAQFFDKHLQVRASPCLNMRTARERRGMWYAYGPVLRSVIDVSFHRGQGVQNPVTRPLIK